MIEIPIHVNECFGIMALKHTNFMDRKPLNWWVFFPICDVAPNGKPP